ncbi:hypothetical protein V6N13_040938 [Hibiscus sabdariffa]
MFKKTGRRVKYPKNKESQIVLVGNNLDAIEKKKSNFTRDEVNPLLYDEQGNPRTSQHFPEKAINDPYPISCASNQEKSKSQVISLSKPHLSFLAINDQTCREANSPPFETLRVGNTWSYQIPFVSLINLGNEDFISRGIGKSSGSGLIENEEIVNFVFSPGFNEGSMILFDLTISGLWMELLVVNSAIPPVLVNQITYDRSGSVTCEIFAVLPFLLF